MTRDPSAAPPRPDLGFLRHRSLRAAPTPAPPPGLADFLAGHAHHAEPSRRPEPAAVVAPGAAPAAPASLDLDDVVTPAAPAARAATSATAPAAGRPSAPGPTTSPQVRRTPPITRVTATGRLVLDATTPSVTLTRVQSGIGTLTIDAACSPEVGDLRLGCAYRLRDGSTSLISTVGERSAPAGSRRPVLQAGRDQFQRISLDLRSVRDVERLLVLAFSESRSALAWGGTIVVTTHAGARVEAPLVGLGAGSVAVLLSVYQAGGELAVWTEMLAGDSVRDGCRAFGFEDMTWVDDRTPLD